MLCRWGAEPHLRTRGSVRGGGGSALLRSCGSGEPRGALRIHGERPGGPSPCAVSEMGWGKDGGSVSLCPQSPRGALVKRIGFRCHI